MASSSTSEHECPVCLETFKDPKVLPCGHSLCAECIDTIKGETSTVKCPKCCREFPVPPGGFPTNYDLRDLINRKTEKKPDGKYACFECPSELHLEQLCICENCDRRMICGICALKNHTLKTHVVHVLSEFVETKQKKLDSWRENFMKIAAASIDWDYEPIITGFLREGLVGECSGERFQRAFSGLKNQWDGVIKDIHGANAKELVITGEFEKYFVTTEAEIEKWTLKHKILTDQARIALNTLKKTNTVFSEVAPDLVEDVDDYKPKGVFRLVLKDFTKMIMDNKKESPVCMIRGLPWKIQSYCHQTNDGVKGLAAFICCNMDSQSVTWSCAAECVLRIISQKDGIKNAESKFSQVFSPQKKTDGGKKHNWGWYDFVVWEVILNPDRGYIKDDTVIVEAEVCASVPVL